MTTLTQTLDDLDFLQSIDLGILRTSCLCLTYRSLFLTTEIARQEALRFVVQQCSNRDQQLDILVASPHLNTNIVAYFASLNNHRVPRP